VCSKRLDTADIVRDACLQQISSPYDLGRSSASDYRWHQLRNPQETDSSLHDSDKNRLFGCENYKSGREVLNPSPWAEGDFEEKKAMLLRWANTLNRPDPAFALAQSLLEGEDSLVGRIIRRIKARAGQ